MEYVKLVLLDNRFEGDVIRELLESEGISVQIRKFGEDGLDIAFSMMHGWGVVSVPDGEVDRALGLLKTSVLAGALDSNELPDEVRLGRGVGGDAGSAH